MKRLGLGVFLVAMASLALEIMITRVFEVIFEPNMAYFVVTTAVFGFGLAGVYAALRPIQADALTDSRLAGLAMALGVATCVLVPLINALPLDYREFFRAPMAVGSSLLVLYLLTLLPFFLAGLFLITVFSTHARQIRELYFWDLVGAGLGTLLVIPFITELGPGGLIFMAGGLAFVAAALFADNLVWRGVAAAAAAVAIGIPAWFYPEYVDVENKVDKRNVRTAVAAGELEVTVWDPISKIQVFDLPWTAERAKAGWPSGDKKIIQYDGGNQSSYFYPFDGEFETLRDRLRRDPGGVHEHFWHLSTLASHHLKRDSGQSVLVIGSAGGQETKAALMYGASRVQAIELVAAVIDLGKNAYASYIGNIFNHPWVDVRAAEGRSFLRQSNEKFDIIQIFSNHTSSSIAQGTGALAPSYLQTAEAYLEYFSRLADEGVLHINHHYYPRMITTAAKAWKESGRDNFQAHVAVYSSRANLALPTLLIKMTPWTEAEIRELSAFMSPPGWGPDRAYALVENPIEPGKSFLSPVFYSGEFPKSLDETIPVRLSPRTDDRPYFSMVRKEIRYLDADTEPFLTPAMEQLANRQLRRGFLPLDLLHIIWVAALSIVAVFAFVIVPLRFSKAGRAMGTDAVPLLIYFSCLGSGFIIIELIYIQKFMQLIGSPLYTYATVLFTTLVAAGIGSMSSVRLGIDPQRRWRIPFIAVIAIGLATIAFQKPMFGIGLAFDQVGRALFSAALIFPIAFFLGMCLPLGVLAIERRPQGAIAWAWGMNGVFTVAGGVGSTLLSLALGFNGALFVALSIYLVAMLVFPWMRDGHEAPFRWSARRSESASSVSVGLA